MIIDISLPIGPGMLVWPTDPSVSITPAKRIARGDSSNVSEMRFGTHTGTHVDPPSHFIDGGAGVDRVAIDVFAGPAYVVDLRGARGAIGPDALDALMLPDDTRRVLLKTDNSQIWRTPAPTFPTDYVSLSPEGAAWMVRREIVLVGTDFLSIEAYDAPGHPTHHTLLGAGVVIVEGLDLFDVEPGRYTLACLPLKVLDGDGAPARAILISE